MKSWTAYLLQNVEGLGDAPLVRTGCEIWEWSQGEKKEVAREILSERPLCQTALSGVQEAEASEENRRETEWRHRGQLEARLREINERAGSSDGWRLWSLHRLWSEIGSKRLAADPAASLCITCQKSAEVEAVLSMAVSY